MTWDLGTRGPGRRCALAAALLVVILAGLAGVRAAAPAPRPGPAEGLGSGPYPHHDPIRIEGDGNLLLPDPVSGNGVRRGLGTAERPYVIENWTIPVDEGAAIVVRDTTRHLVIRNIVFDRSTSAFASVSVGGAANVTVANMEFRGSTDGTNEKPFRLRDARNVLISNVTVHGSVTVDAETSRGVTFQEIVMNGAHATMSLGSGTYQVLDSRITNRWTGEGLANSAMNVATGSDAERCRLTVDNLTTRNVSSAPALDIGQGCSVDLSNVTLRNSPAGIRLRGDNDVTIEGLQAVHAVRSRLTDEDDLQAGLKIGPGSNVTLEASSFEGFREGLLSADSSFEVERTTFERNRIGVAVRGDCGGCVIRASSFLASGQDHIRNLGESTVDARHNWWGSADGPADEMVEGPVRVHPWRSDGPPASSGEPTASLGALLPLASLVALVAAAVLVQKRG